VVLGSIRNLTIIGEQSATGNQSSRIYLDLAEIGGCFRSRLLGKTASHTGSMSTCRQIILSVEANRVQASMRLITGMLVSSSVITQSTAMATESSQTAKGEPMSSICSSPVDHDRWKQRSAAAHLMELSAAGANAERTRRNPHRVHRGLAPRWHKSSPDPCKSPKPGSNMRYCDGIHHRSPSRSASQRWALFESQSDPSRC
jgi:hypothetical protein